MITRTRIFGRSLPIIHYTLPSSGHFRNSVRKCSSRLAQLSTPYSQRISCGRKSEPLIRKVFQLPASVNWQIGFAISAKKRNRLSHSEYRQGCCAKRPSSLTSKRRQRDSKMATISNAPVECQGAGNDLPLPPEGERISTDFDPAIEVHVNFKCK